MISIIIPIYNKENSLKKCIDSVIQQTYKDIEIILVNDGSKDYSGKICDEYKEIDRRIKVIHKQNGGVSSARNEGIKNALGEFIQFVDADDRIDKYMCEKLHNEVVINDYDLVICGMEIVKNGKVIENVEYSNKRFEELYELKDYFIEYYKKYLFNSPVNKLYKKKKIKELFDEELSLGEDLLFNLKYLKGCSKISVLKEKLYVYNIGNINSLTGIYRKNEFDIVKRLDKEINNFCAEVFNSCNQFITFNNAMFINSLTACIQKLCYFSKDKDNEIVKEIKKYINDKIVINKLEKVNVDYIREKVVYKIILSKCSKNVYYYFKFKRFIYNLIIKLRK